MGMTEEERCLVENNERLVHHVLKSFNNIPQSDYDDWYQTGCIG